MALSEDESLVRLRMGQVAGESIGGLASCDRCRDAQWDAQGVGYRTAYWERACPADLISDSAGLNIGSGDRDGEMDRFCGSAATVSHRRDLVLADLGI